MRVIQPRRWGGYEMDPRVFLEIGEILASGCGSTGWIYCVLGVHHWQLGLMDEQAQRDVWGDDDTILMSSSYTPRGKVERAEGGYRLSGRWSFSSGCAFAQWAIVGGLVLRSWAVLTLGRSVVRCGGGTRRSRFFPDRNREPLVRRGETRCRAAGDAGSGSGA